MPVPTAITDLSTAAANNFPAGSDTPSSLDDTIRNHGAFIAQLRDGTGFTAGAISGADIGSLPSGIVTLASLVSAVQAALVPAGTVLPFAATLPPVGYLECNGNAVSRTTYADLFAVIGTTYGAGDGATTFALPDLRGEFVRGWDNARGADSGRAFGSFQADELEAHTHTATTAAGGTHTHGLTTYLRSDTNHTHDAGAAPNGTAALTDSAISSSAVQSGGSHTHTVTVNSTGGTETRPRNVALMYVIKT